MNQTMEAEEKLKDAVSALNTAWAEYERMERCKGRRPELGLWIDWGLRAVIIEERRRVY